MLTAQMLRPPMLFWLLQSPFSLALLAISAAIALVGIVLCIRPQRTASIVLVFVAFLPGVISAGMVLSAAAKFSDLARSPTTPSPSDLAEVIGMAFSFSLIGLLATMIPLLIAIVALIRSTSGSRDLSEENDHP